MTHNYPEPVRSGSPNLDSVLCRVVEFTFADGSRQTFEVDGSGQGVATNFQPTFTGVDPATRARVKSVLCSSVTAWRVLAPGPWFDDTDEEDEW